MERKPDATEGVHSFIKFKFWFSSEEQVPYPKGFSNAPLAQLPRKSPWGSRCVQATVPRAVGNTKASAAIPQM